MPKLIRNKGTDDPVLSDIDHDAFPHTRLPHTSVSNLLDGLIERVGSLASWLWVLTIGFILYSVISRYVFAQGSVMLEEIQWHLAGAAWLIGLSYTLVHDDHVRVDVIHERLSLRAQAWIELLGMALLLLPFLGFVMMEVVPYAWSSFLQSERSQAPNGLPWRWAIKAFLPISIGLLMVASVSRLLKTTALLFGRPAPLAHDSVTGKEG